MRWSVLRARSAGRLAFCIALLSCVLGATVAAHALARSRPDGWTRLAQAAPSSTAPAATPQNASPDAMPAAAAPFSAPNSAPAASELRRERRALLYLREDRLRDLGGLTLEMYRRDQFNEALVVERCAELVAIEARVSEIDALVSGAGLRRRQRAVCECGAPLLIGARYCPSCGRSLDDETPGEDTAE